MGDLSKASIEKTLSMVTPSGEESGKKPSSDRVLSVLPNQLDA